MPQLKSIKIDIIDATGCLIEYRLKHALDEYQLTGGAGANLTGGITIRQDAADDKYVGLTYKLWYGGDVVYTGGNVITVFDKTLTAVQARQPLNIEATWDGSAWDVSVTPDLSAAGGISKSNLNADVFSDYTAINTGTDITTATTPKSISDWFVYVLANLIGTWAKLQTFTLGIKLSNIAVSKFLVSGSGSGVQGVDMIEMISKEVSFESGEQGDNSFYIPYNFTILQAYTHVTKQIAGTDNGTITAKINGVTITGIDPITYPASEPVDSSILAAATLNNTGAAYDTVTLVAAKTTAGGRVFVQLAVQRNI